MTDSQDNRQSLLDDIRDQAKSDFESDRYPAVAELLHEYLKFCPDDAFMWFTYGDALRCLGRWQESEHALRIGLDKAPAKEKFWVETRFAKLFEEQGMHEQAESWYARSANRPEPMELDWFWILRGANFARLGLHARAKECYERAIDIAGDNLDEACLNMGLVLRAGREYDAARAFFERALYIESDYVEAEEALESLAGLSESLDAVERLAQLE